MAYACQIGPGHWIYLDNQGVNTVLTVATSGAGQQQQATSHFALGAWTAEPTILASGSGVVVRLATAAGERFIQVQGSQVGLAAAPSSGSVQALPLQDWEGGGSSPLPAMDPMTPMPPLQMGNMQMSLNPMAMQMGNMAMRMGEPTPASPSPPAQAAGQRFCTQCGQPVKPQDRFCGQCGHSLAESG